MTANDKTTDPALGFAGPIPGPATKQGPDGRTLRRRWTLTGYQAPVLGNAHFQSAFVPDDGTPDGEVLHEWHEGDGFLPLCLVVTGWTYWSCHREYERLWAERKAAETAS
ncbi:hypothetical protein [Kitasatospora sp. NPDC088783]|uniref:hypothetical protein n=1 Tax=Kitasatospora sp. NPDC088783 TaxID=3364077 RepID=UPI003829D907